MKLVNQGKLSLNESFYEYEVGGRYRLIIDFGDGEVITYPESVGGGDFDGLLKRSYGTGEVVDGGLLSAQVRLLELEA